MVQSLVQRRLLYPRLLQPATNRTSVNKKVMVKKLKPDEFFMGKPSQNYGVSPKYGVTQFYLQLDISEHIPP